MVKEEKIDNLAILADKLQKSILENKKSEKYAATLEVLSKLGMGSLLICSFLMPGTARLFTLFEKSGKEWKQYNKSFLLKSLRSLYKKKMIKTTRIDEDQFMIEITNEGKKNILTASLKSLNIPRKIKWDGRWYFVSYDIPRGHDFLRDTIRKHLIKMGFYPFQKSLYLYPFPCQREIEFMRELLGLEEYVRIIEARKIENDQVFRDYFGI